MSGETEKQISGWTVDTLHQHMLARLAEADRRYEDRFKAMQEAIGKAERANELRFQSVNEFRQALTDAAAKFMTRDAFEEFQKATAAYRESINGRFEQINTRLNMREGMLVGTQENKSELRGNIGIVISIATTVATAAAFLVTTFLNHKG